METKKYRCSCCNYQTEIPIDVLKEITKGKFNKYILPKIVCPYCSGFLSYMGD